MSAEQLLKAPLVWGFVGETYKLALPDFEIELAFQARQEELALRKVQQHRRLLGEDGYARQLDGWRHDMASNSYAFGGSLSSRYLATDAGLAEYVLLLMQMGQARHGGAEADPHLMDSIRADAKLWGELASLVLRRDFPNVFAGENPPPSTPGATPSPSTAAPSPSSPAVPGADAGPKS